MQRPCLQSIDEKVAMDELYAFPNYKEFSSFLQSWENKYLEKINKIDLFNPSLTKNWTYEQKAHFAKVFYYCRGHFHEFLWFMGNHAPNADFKKMILQNIAEEFSLNGRSHELLYHDFMESLGIDLNNEFINEKNYLSFAQEFNRGHLEWLRSHDWDSCMAAFAAYEKLDNIDYARLYLLAESFGLKKRDLIFFSVHIHVEHFDATIEPLVGIWQANPERVSEAFTFIGDHQIKMWRKLSEEIFNHA